MEWIFGGVALFGVGGIALAIYERRKGLRIRDERASESTATPDMHRAQDAFRHGGFAPGGGDGS